MSLKGLRGVVIDFYFFMGITVLFYCRLRKFVNLGGDKLSQENVVVIDDDKSPDTNGNRSPFASRLEEGNPQAETSTMTGKEEKNTKIHLDSEDEDYTFDGTSYFTDYCSFLN